jgi:membrane-associated phospholipid phosphatase
LETWPLDWRAGGEMLVAYLVLVGIGFALAWLILETLSGTALTNFDNDAAIWYEAGRSAALDGWTELGSALAGTFNVIGALVVLMAGFVWYWRRWREALTLGLALALEASVFLTVSLTVGRDRPPVEQLDVSPPTASFPSGHTGAAFALYIGLAVIVFWNTDSRLIRAIAVAGAIILPVAVAISRLYRGMHFITDVAAGAVLGILCVVAAIGIVSRAIAREQTGEETG